MSGKVVHTGQAIVDLVLTVDALPAAGEDVFASSHAFLAGGGFNVMAAARRDGARVVYAGGHGTGRFGDIVRAAMTEEGVEITASADPEIDTGFSIAMIDAAAERTFVSTLGAEGELSLAHLESANAAAGDIVYVSGYGLYHPRNAAALSTWLPRLSPTATVVVDSSPMIAHIPHDAFAAVRARADLWTANEKEARSLARRCDVDAELEPEALAGMLCRTLGATVLVRVNRNGCWVAEEGREAVRVPAIEMAPVDTNGAGDAHTGVLCAGLLEGRPLLEAVRRAGAAAAIAVTRRGPATSPVRAEIEELLASIR